MRRHHRANLTKRFSLPALPALMAIVVPTLSLLFALWVAPARAQDLAEDESESESGWRPPQGSLFGAENRNFRSPDEEDNTLRPTVHGATEEDDGREPLLVFDLSIEDGVRFDESELEQFETTYWEVVNADPDYRSLSSLDRSRRLREHGQIITGDVTAERASEIAESIEVSHYLMGRIGISDSRHFSITVDVGAAESEETGQLSFSETTGRGIDDVNSAIRRLLEEALLSLRTP